MAKLKQKQWMTLSQAAQHLSEIADEPGISEQDLIQHAIEGNLTLSLHSFSDFLPAMPGQLVRPDEGQVRLSSISEVVRFCDIQTRQEMSKGKTHVISDGYLPEDLEDAARAVLLGYELTDENQKALNQINSHFPDKPKGHWSFGFTGQRFTGKGYDLIFEIVGTTTMISGTWDIAMFGDGKTMLERTWQCAQSNPDAHITSLRTIPDGTLYLVHKDGIHCAEVNHVDVALSEDCVLCVRPQNLRALFEDEVDEIVEPHARPKLRSEVQKEAILDTLRKKLEMDPLNLPERPEGPNRGPKGHCWDLLKSNRQLFTRNSFDDAWKDLKRTGEIKGG